MSTRPRFAFGLSQIDCDAFAGRSRTWFEITPALRKMFDDRDDIQINDRLCIINDDHPIKTRLIVRVLGIQVISACLGLANDIEICSVKLINVKQYDEKGKEIKNGIC